MFIKQEARFKFKLYILFKLLFDLCIKVKIMNEYICVPLNALDQYFQ